jgi:hypothetical protein
VPLPDDFPAPTYAAIRDRVLRAADAVASRDSAAAPSGSAGSAGHAEARDEFAGAWDAVAFRFVAAAESADALVGYLSDQPATPLPERSYLEDRALFALLANGVAALEALCYGLFAIGGLIDPAQFPLASPADRRNATMGATLRVFDQVFHDEPITRSLFWWLNSQEFGWWREVRNILSRRTLPPRPVEAAALTPEAEWRIRGELIDAGMPKRKRAWLVEVVTSLLADTDSFTARHLSA